MVSERKERTLRSYRDKVSKLNRNAKKGVASIWTIYKEDRKLARDKYREDMKAAYDKCENALIETYGEHARD